MQAKCYATLNVPRLCLQLTTSKYITQCTLFRLQTFENANDAYLFARANIRVGQIWKLDFVYTYNYIVRTRRVFIRCTVDSPEFWARCLPTNWGDDSTISSQMIMWTAHGTEQISANTLCTSKNWYLRRLGLSQAYCWKSTVGGLETLHWVVPPASMYTGPTLWQPLQSCRNTSRQYNGGIWPQTPPANCLEMNLLNISATTIESNAYAVVKIEFKQKPGLPLDNPVRPVRVLLLHPYSHDRTNGETQLPTLDFTRTRSYHALTISAQQPNTRHLVVNSWSTNAHIIGCKVLLPTKVQQADTPTRKHQLFPRSSWVHWHSTNLYFP